MYSQGLARLTCTPILQNYPGYMMQGFALKGTKIHLLASWFAPPLNARFLLRTPLPVFPGHGPGFVHQKYTVCSQLWDARVLSADTSEEEIWTNGRGTPRPPPFPKSVMGTLSQTTRVQEENRSKTQENVQFQVIGKLNFLSHHAALSNTPPHRNALRLRDSGSFSGLYTSLCSTSLQPKCA